MRETRRSNRKSVLLLECYFCVVVTRVTHTSAPSPPLSIPRSPFTPCYLVVSTQGFVLARCFLAQQDAHIFRSSYLTIGHCLRRSPLDVLPVVCHVCMCLSFSYSHRQFTRAFWDNFPLQMSVDVVESALAEARLDFFQDFRGQSFARTERSAVGLYELQGSTLVESINFARNSPPEHIEINIVIELPSVSRIARSPSSRNCPETSSMRSSTMCPSRCTISDWSVDYSSIIVEISICLKRCFLYCSTYFCEIDFVCAPWTLNHLWNTTVLAFFKSNGKNQMSLVIWNDTYLQTSSAVRNLVDSYVFSVPNLVHRMEIKGGEEGEVSVFSRIIFILNFFPGFIYIFYFT